MLRVWNVAVYLTQQTNTATMSRFSTVEQIESVTATIFNTIVESGFHKAKGFDHVKIARSRKAFGNSNYVICFNEGSDMEIKFRISDHGVSNHGRVVSEWHVIDAETTVNDILFEVNPSMFVLAPFTYLGRPFDYQEVTKDVDSFVSKGWEVVSSRVSKSGNNVFKIRKENVSFNKVRVN